MVSDDWRGQGNTRKVTAIPAPPKDDSGWSICAAAHICSAMFKPGLLLFVNGGDAECLVVATVDGAQYAAVVPARGRRIGPGPERWNPIEGRSSVQRVEVRWQTHANGLPVATVGSR